MCIQGIHPWRLTWNIIMEVWKIIILSKWVICRFHVNLPGCTSSFVLSRLAPSPWKAHPPPSFSVCSATVCFVSMETRCCTGHWAQHVLHVFPWKRVKYLGGLTSLSVDEGATLLMERYPERFHHLLSIQPYVKHIEKWDILQINWLNRISSNNSSFQNISWSKRYIQPSRTWKVDAISLWCI